MTRTLTRRLSTVGLVALLALAGCSSDEAEDDNPSPTGTPASVATASPEDFAALDTVSVEGPLRSAPTTTFPTPFTVSAGVAKLLDPGDGEKLQEDDLLKLSLVEYHGADGSTRWSSYDEGQLQTSAFNRGDLGDVIYEALADANIGARAVFATPVPDDSDGTAVVVLVIDVAEVFANHAVGEPVAPVAGLPTVALAEDGTPTITVPGGEAPADLVVQPLITGAGPVVESGQTVMVQYSGVKWGDGQPFDSSWENGKPFTVTLGQGQVIAGWDEGLVGQTVGSQVLLVVPPAKGYGASEGHELQQETLVFVVDILTVF